MTPLARILGERIRTQGPITVAEFMALALGHPEHGYYRKRDPLGVAGDFTTAPEVSQMFGEMVGAWCATVWQMMGRPTFRLVELGPGRGTLMADLLRAAAGLPGFLAAAEIHLVETSPALRQRQRAVLGGRAAHWHDDLAAVPDGPMLLVANEFFDALPIRQFERTPEGWRERLVAAEGDGFRFVLGPPVDAGLPPALAQAPVGAVAETCPQAKALAGAIGRRLAAHGGAALIIDYGPARSAPGDSLQAVRRHAYHPPLADPGEADITAHVDFQALSEAAAPAAAHGPVTQGEWLERLGIRLRAAALARANPQRLGEIDTALRRLIDGAEMGTLFKAMALADPRLPTLPGFERSRP